MNFDNLILEDLMTGLYRDKNSPMNGKIVQLPISLFTFKADKKNHAVELLSLSRRYFHYTTVIKLITHDFKKSKNM